MKKLPIGIQTFEEIRTGNYIYIDKTKEAYDLITTTKYAFLSRPRRFGKSLFVDTLRCIFEGRKELFEGLYIYDKWDWEDKYPVIKLSWEGELETLKNIKKYFIQKLEENNDLLNVECVKDRETPSVYFKTLIMEAYKKYQKKIVILIDEYDKPLLDNIDKRDFAQEVRDFLRGVYSVIKGSDEYIRFVFLTGVSKFSKTSIFSGLNMLKDITLDPRYGNICGYTQNDLDTSFAEMLEGVDKEKVKEWYNGYNFLKDKVYNPFDILLFIDNNHTFDNYWFVSGTPTFLMKLLKEKNYYLPNISNLVIDKKQLDSYDIDNMNLEVLLFQSGYLTIEEMRTTPYETIEYKLCIPNKEVKMSLFDHIIMDIYENSKPNPIKNKIYYFVAEEKPELLKEALEAIFAAIPYNYYTKNNIYEYEGFYASVVFSYLQSLGFDIIGEDVTNLGRIDITIRHKQAIYVIEFKVGKEDAMEYLKKQNYHQKYMIEDKPIYLIGINFNKESKNVEKYQWEKVK